MLTSRWPQQNLTQINSHTSLYAWLIKYLHNFTHNSCHRFVYDLDIPLVNGRVPFHKTAFELVKRVSMSNIPEGGTLIWA